MRHLPGATLGVLVLAVLSTVIQVQPAKCIPPETLPAAIAQPSPEATTSESKKAELSTCITAIAAQSDPAKLATLGERAANPRLKRIMYWLAAARDTGADPGDVVDQAQKMNRSFGTPRAPLVKASLLRNLKICDGLGLLTPQDLRALRHGSAPIVNRGPYAGQTAEVDHIIPLARAYEIGNELANLEMLPATLNRSKSAKVGERQLDLAKKFRDGGLISEATMANIQASFRPSSTARYEQSTPETDYAEPPVPNPTPFVPAPQAVSTTATGGSTVFFLWPWPFQAFFPPVVSSLSETIALMAGERMVWVNTESHIYHLPHSRWYGKTREGKYMSEADALAEGDRAAKNRQ
jgi:hypothetical protein